MHSFSIINATCPDLIVDICICPSGLELVFVPVQCLGTLFPKIQSAVLPTKQYPKLQGDDMVIFDTRLEISFSMYANCKSSASCLCGAFWKCFMKLLKCQNVEKVSGDKV